MEITKTGSQASIVGPQERYTGPVRVDPLFSDPREPSRSTGTLVTFEPGARTRWHRHPLGQYLYVIQGMGLVQRLGGPVEVIRPGDVVWIEPNEKHWHGATPTTGMSHVAVQEQQDGSVAEWLEMVPEEEYRVGC